MGYNGHMYFHDYEVPVAYAMITLLESQPPVMGSPFDGYCCCWIAFNNIYATLNDRVGTKKRKLKFKNGVQQFQNIAHVVMTKIEGSTEWEQIEEAVIMLPLNVKHSLISHPSVDFFVNRTPRFEGQKLEYDVQGQKLNGVLNVGFTVNRDFPVWSPIDPGSHATYMAGDPDFTKRNPANREPLMQQIVALLYTVRNNTFHGGKRADDARDVEVANQAFPLLKLIVDSFLIR
jgi:hypothetical protein